MIYSTFYEYNYLIGKAGPDGQFTRIIQVPSFAETATIVLLNIDTLVCFPVKFSAIV